MTQTRDNKRVVQPDLERVFAEDPEDMWESALKEFLQQAPNADLNRCGPCGNTALHYAAMAGSARAVCWLFERGADAEVASETGHTYGHKPLMWALMCHSSSEAEKAADLLFDAMLWHDRKEAARRDNNWGYYTSHAMRGVSVPVTRKLLDLASNSKIRRESDHLENQALAMYRHYAWDVPGSPEMALADRAQRIEVLVESRIRRAFRWMPWHPRSAIA